MKKRIAASLIALLTFSSSFAYAPAYALQNSPVLKLYATPGLNAQDLRDQGMDVPEGNGLSKEYSEFLRESSKCVAALVAAGYPAARGAKTIKEAVAAAGLPVGATGYASCDNVSAAYQNVDWSNPGEPAVINNEN